MIHPGKGGPILQRLLFNVFKVRMWAKWIRPSRARIISGKSFFGSVPKLPVQNVTSVKRRVHCLHQLFDLVQPGNDSRQSENRPDGIVGMNRHLDVILLRYGPDTLKEVHEVVKESLFIDLFIRFKKIFMFARRSGSQPGIKKPSLEAVV